MVRHSYEPDHPDFVCTASLKGKYSSLCASIPAVTQREGDVGANVMSMIPNKAWNIKMALKQEGVSNILAVCGSKAFEYLVTSLWDQDKWVRIAAADALAGLEDIRAYRYMVTLLGDTDPDVRFAVSVSLGKLGDARAIRPLESACHDRNYFVRQGAGESLNRLNKITQNPGMTTWER
jgi:hypothetical protein